MNAKDYFHLAPYNWNCAQAIHKSFQDQTQMSDDEIELMYRPMGGGRAPEGMCGAIYAVRSLVGEGTAEAEALTTAFVERTGGLTCRELKGKHGRPCSWLVEQAEELLRERIS
ncbi:MAG: C-GCAxxG-C-C family (seleno)protein [Porphyromonas sp.]|nr:C-GCAxxG-C-C family (seleno)protein [Porphyromonas sp.]